MNGFRLILMLVNLVACLGLIVIPLAILTGFAEARFGASLVFGWLIFFVPFFASVLTLSGICFSFNSITGNSIVVAFTGSFLIAWLPLFMVWKNASADFMIIGLAVSVIVAFNVIAMWDPFKEHIATGRSNDNNE